MVNKKKLKKVKQIKVIKKVKKIKKDSVDVHNICVKPEEIPIKVSKFVGFCKCGFTISTVDFESTMIFVCPSCSERQTKGKLLKDNGREKYESKKDFLESTVNTQYIDSIPMKEDVPSELTKKFEDDD